jgi:hypothetical protein
MKWMLAVMIFGTQPVKTDLTFDTLDKCLAAEQATRSEESEKFNAWIKDAGPLRGERDALFMERRFGLQNQAVCIPHK